MELTNSAIKFSKTLKNTRRVKLARCGWLIQ